MTVFLSITGAIRYAKPTKNGDSPVEAIMTAAGRPGHILPTRDPQ